MIAAVGTVCMPGLAQASADLPTAPTPTAQALAAYQSTLPAGVVVDRPSGAALPLSLDEAVTQAVAHNLGMELSRENERRIGGLRSTVLNALTPSLVARGSSSTEEINLAAMGFKPQSLGALVTQPGQGAANFQTIVKVNVTSAQLSLNQQLFNVPAYFLYRASQKATAVATWQTANERGSVTLRTGTQYLLVLADVAQIENARSQVQSDQVALAQARARQSAGVGVHLDTLRAEVQLRNEQQVLIAAENTYSKDKIALNRIMGLPADQELQLTDTTPYADLAMLPHDDLLARAYTERKDLRVLESEREVLLKTERAARYERLPTLAMSGYYGVLGETTGLYHGVFTAQGRLSFPIFEEAQFRGEREVAQAELMTVARQIDSLRGTIDQQIRDSMLDIASSKELVRVARSNVELARQELADSEERFRAGVADNLPVVQAQATLADAEGRLVQATYQYNVAKLQLGTNVGDISRTYRTLLGL